MTSSPVKSFWLIIKKAVGCNAGNRISDESYCCFRYVFFFENKPKALKGYIFEDNKQLLYSKIIPNSGISGTPKTTDPHYQRKKKHQLFCKRAGIEPTIGHLKTDYRLGRNFYKGLVGGCYQCYVDRSCI